MLYFLSPSPSLPLSCLLLVLEQERGWKRRSVILQSRSREEMMCTKAFLFSVFLFCFVSLSLSRSVRKKRRVQKNVADEKKITICIVPSFVSSFFFFPPSPTLSLRLSLPLIPPAMGGFGRGRGGGGVGGQPAFSGRGGGAGFHSLRASGAPDGGGRCVCRFFRFFLFRFFFFSRIPSLVLTFLTCSLVIKSQSLSNRGRGRGRGRGGGGVGGGGRGEGSGRNNGNFFGNRDESGEVAAVSPSVFCFPLNFDARLLSQSQYRIANRRLV